jgi:Cys-tRNA(Pro) deacylase
MKEKIPVTAALRVLKDKNVDFSLRVYKYEEKGGTRVSARELGVDEHQIIKTLVMEDDRKQPLIILMHGDRQVSTKNLARALGVKGIKPCDPKIAEKHTGYKVGGTSPFGTRKPLPIYMEESIVDMPRILINAGSRGLLAEISPLDLIHVLNPVTVHVALE